MKVKTCELKGPALDYAVSLSELSAGLATGD